LEDFIEKNPIDRIMMICLACGYFNEGTTGNCEKCGLPLAPFPAAPPFLEGQLSTLRNSAQKVILGQISIEDFEGVLERFENRLKEVSSFLETLAVPEEMRLDLLPELTVGSEGLRLHQEALQAMRDYVSSRNLGVLQEGLGKAEKANEKINEAMQLNWKSFLNWKEMTEDLLAQYLPGSPT